MILSGEQYLCVAGETFDSVALAVYGDEQYTADLLCANPAACGITQFTGGELLDLPVVEIPAKSENGAPVKAPWKE